MGGVVGGVCEGVQEGDEGLGGDVGRGGVQG